MSSVLSGIKTAIIGGDDRELILVNELVKMGATVAVAGFPREIVSHGAFVVNTVEEACRHSEVIILPLPGMNPEGMVRAIYADTPLQLSEEAISKAADNALIIIGSARPMLKDWCRRYNYHLLEIAEMDELAILNSIPSAEGALQIAMEETDITIHGSKTCVIGFGRVAVTLARILKAIGSDVTVVARSKSQLARAYEMGCRCADFSALRSIMNHVDIIFNTVPALVLDAEVLEHARQSALIIDLASQPGGTDFEAANKFGIKSILAPGLPGKVAPRSAGKIMADVIPSLIIQELSRLDEPLILTE